MKIFHWAIGWILIPAAVAATSGETLQLNSFLTHSRFTVRVDASVPIERKTSADGFSLHLKGIGLNDLGAPIGDEDRWKNLYRNLGDSRVEKVEIEETRDGVVITGKWKFPTGKLSLARPVMEFFDYREKTPPRYVVDFWIQKGPTKVEFDVARRKAEHLANLKKTRDEAERKIAKRLAFEKKRAEAANVRHFCDKPLSEEKDAFIEFHPVHEKFNFSKWLPTTTADHRFRYFKPKSKDKEAQYIRLALNLYSQSDIGLAVKAIDFFEAEFRHSKYALEMKFLRANCLIKLGLRDAGEHILRQLVSDQRESPVALVSAMYLASRQADSGSPHQALQAFLWLIQYYPHHDLSWVFHLGAAESLYTMHEVDRAVKEYRWVVDHGPTEESRAEGAYRIGDLYQGRFQYEQSLVAYFQALKYFPRQSDRIPSFQLNRGESFYQVQKYDRAKEIFEDFLNRFPAHPEGWRAAFRLGEIAERGELKGNRNSADSVARNWYYETINRYPLSAGATLARLRLLPCGDHGGFTFESAERFFQKVRTFDAPNSIVMKNFSDFRALARVRTLITLGTDDQIARGSIEELPSAKSATVRKLISSVANDSFQKVIFGLLSEGKKYEALAFYSQVGPRVPTPEEAVEMTYLLKLSQAASELGMGNFAAKLSQTYADQVAQQKKIANAGRKVASIGPSSSTNADYDRETDDAEQERNHSERAFTEAKALWTVYLNTGNNAAFTTIRKLLAEVKDDSSFSRDTELLLAMLDEKDGKPESALRHATKAQILGSSLRMDCWIAALHEQYGDQQIALDLYRAIETQLASKNSSENHKDFADMKGLPEVPDLANVLKAQAGILEKQKKWGEVAAVYERGMSYGVDSGSFQYAYARALTETHSGTNIKKAMRVLEKIATEKSTDKKDEKSDEGFWGRLAQENLENLQSTQKLNELPRRASNE